MAYVFLFGKEYFQVLLLFGRLCDHICSHKPMMVEAVAAGGYGREWSCACCMARWSAWFFIAGTHTLRDMPHSALSLAAQAKMLVFLTTGKQVKFALEAFRRLRPGVVLRSLHGKMKQMKRMAVYYDFCQVGRCSVNIFWSRIAPTECRPNSGR